MYAGLFCSLLLMFLEPDGPSYEMQLVGEVKSQRIPQQPLLPKPALESSVYSNKQFLAWGGVQIGRAL